MIRMALTVTYIGSKDEFIKHLRDQAGVHQSLAKSTGGAEKARQQGIAEGLEFAAAEVDHWDLLASFATDDKLRENGQPQHAGAGYQAP
jgi:hypothetical protein